MPMALSQPLLYIVIAIKTTNWRVDHGHKFISNIIIK
jgi:hypothetical protein